MTAADAFSDSQSKLDMWSTLGVVGMQKEKEKREGEKEREGRRRRKMKDECAKKESPDSSVERAKNGPGGDCPLPYFRLPPLLGFSCTLNGWRNRSRFFGLDAEHGYRGMDAQGKGERARFRTERHHSLEGKMLAGAQGVE